MDLPHPYGSALGEETGHRSERARRNCAYSLSSTFVLDYEGPVTRGYDTCELMDGT